MPTFTNADIYITLSTIYVHVDNPLIYIGFINSCSQIYIYVDKMWTFCHGLATLLANDKINLTTPYLNLSNLLNSSVTSSYQQLQSWLEEKSIEITID